VIVRRNAEKRVLCPFHGENRGSIPLGRANNINIIAKVERFGVLFVSGLWVGRAVNVRPFAQQRTHGTCRGLLLHDPQTESTRASFRREKHGDILVDKPTTMGRLSSFVAERRFMGSIRVLKIDRLMQNRVRVDIEVRTSVGRFSFPVDVDDHGSAGNNEREAFLELHTLLEEALELVQHQLG